ncbi:MAG: helix-hairpin-helix domain-containing protein [Elusimicrobiota bacterium]
MFSKKSFYALCSMLFFTMLYALCSPLYPAFEQKPASARPIGMGGAFVGFSNDTNAIDYNPAGLRLIPAFQFASTYTNIYGVEGLGYTNVKFAFPVQGYGDIGFLYSDFGPSEYKESVLIFSHGFGLAEGIMFGYNLKSMGIKIKEYGSDSAFGLDLGVLARVSGDFALGVSAKNINEPEISKGNENLTEEFLTGIFYRPLPGLNFAMDFEKIIDEPVAVHIGTEFRLTDFFVFRTGLQTNPSKYALGFGTNYKTVYFDYGYSSHATLDAMHVVSLSMKWGGEQEATIKYAPKTKKAARTTRKRVDGRKAEGQVTEEAVRPAGKVNINTASSDEIAELPGMGKVMAKRVVDYRGEKGQFNSIEDILNVPRMSRRVYSKIEGLITVEERQKEEPVKKSEEKVEESEKPVPAKPTVSDENEEPQPDAEEPEAPAAGGKSEVTPPPVVPKVVPPAPKVLPTPATKPKVEPAPAPEESIPSGKININKADMSQLRDLGFTTVQSQNILRYIKKNGPMPAVDDLKKVPGISADIIDEVKDNIEIK